MAFRQLTDQEQGFLQSQRVARLATVDQTGEPLVVPVCYAWDGQRLYTPIDEKPKRRDRPLKRVRNIEETGRAALVVDRYNDEDWSRLAWLLIRGSAVILASSDPGHDEAVVLLRERYQQYQSMALEQAPIIAITPIRVSSWGALGQP